MSFRAVARVFDLAGKGRVYKTNALLVLVGLADYGNEDGGNIWPAIETIAEKCNCDPTTVRRVMRQLERDGVLVEEVDEAHPPGGGRGCTRRWRINFEQLQNLAAAGPDSGGSDGKTRANCPGLEAPETRANLTKTRANHPENPGTGARQTRGTEKEPEVIQTSDEKAFSDLVAAYRPVPGDPMDRARAAYAGAISDGADPAEMRQAASAYAEHMAKPAQAYQAKCHLARWLREGRWRSAAPTPVAIADRGDAELGDLPINVTEDCPAEAAKRWRSVIKAVARRHGRAAVVGWFKDLRFDGETAWANGRFVRDQVVNRFETELKGLPVKVSRPDNERAPSG